MPTIADRRSCWRQTELRRYPAAGPAATPAAVAIRAVRKLHWSWVTYRRRRLVEQTGRTDRALVAPVSRADVPRNALTWSHFFELAPALIILGIGNRMRGETWFRALFLKRYGQFLGAAASRRFAHLAPGRRGVLYAAARLGECRRSERSPRTLMRTLDRIHARSASSTRRPAIDPNLRAPSCKIINATSLLHGPHSISN